MLSWMRQRPLPTETPLLLANHQVCASCCCHCYCLIICCCCLIGCCCQSAATTSQVKSAAGAAAVLSLLNRLLLSRLLLSWLLLSVVLLSLLLLNMLTMLLAKFGTRALLLHLPSLLPFQSFECCSSVTPWLLVVDTGCQACQQALVLLHGCDHRHSMTTVTCLADVQARMQSAQASDLQATDRPIANQAPASPSPSRSPAASSRSAAAQPTRFAGETAAEAAPEAAPEAAISNGNISQNGDTIARGLSDTPWLSGEAEKAIPAEPERLSVTRQPEPQLVSQQSLSGASAHSSSGFRAGQMAGEGTAVGPIPISEGIRQVIMKLSASPSCYQE